jgi:hypothetical protein
VDQSRNFIANPPPYFGSCDYLPSFFLPLLMTICYGNSVVRSFCLIVALFAIVAFAGSLRADTYQLTSGETVNGEVLPTSANDAGISVKVGEGDYKKVPWDSFSQEDLRKFRDDPKLSAKLGPLVEPFVVITAEERAKKTEVPNLKQPTRLPRPAAQSLFGALFSSGLGLFLLLVVYGATIYAGYEVAIFRAQPVPLVAGLSAIPLLGVLAPIIFLAMPTKTQPIEQTWETQPATRPESPDAVNPMQGAAPPQQQPAGLRLAASATPEAAAQAAAPGEAKPTLPATQTFARGQFTFNRRFIETKFAGFFGVVRHGADKDMVMVVKAARGQYVCNRISRIAANDFHVEVHHGHASEEIMIPFQEIKEIQLKHKDAP